jgi:hypothetical protein
MDKADVLPPGQHPNDPYKKDIDPVAFALRKVATMLFWIEEHRSSFEHLRNSDPANAERELDNLRDATKQAVVGLHRFIELYLAGYSIDPNKRLPRDFQSSAGELLPGFERLFRAMCGEDKVS